MSNETKREVFEKALDDWQRNFINDLPNDGSFEDWSENLMEYSDRYAAALPDDLPVIPKEVGKYIQERKSAYESLAFALTARWIPKEVSDWMFMVAGDSDTELSQIEYVKQQDTFARAWLLGVWRVEETGKIVKLEVAEHETKKKD